MIKFLSLDLITSDQMGFTCFTSSRGHHTSIHVTLTSYCLKISEQQCYLVIKRMTKSVPTGWQATKGKSFVHPVPSDTVDWWN